MSKVSLLGVSISKESKSDLLEIVKNHLRSKTQKPLTIVTPNPEQIVLAQEDAKFREILNNVDIALPDGSGIEWAINSIGFNSPSPPLTKRGRGGVVKTIPGIEFMEDLVELAARNDWSVGFIGGRNGVAQKALAQLQKNYLGLKGWAENGPEVEIQNSELRIQNISNPIHNSKFIILNSSVTTDKHVEELLKKVKQSNTRILFIGLGAPKQEYFLENFKFQISNFKLSKPGVLMVVGGSFDEISGKIKRPPKFISDLGFKWLWRLILEPWRIKRQLRLVKFVYSVLRKG